MVHANYKKVAETKQVFYDTCMIASRDFFMGNPMRVARRLLGAYLCMRDENGVTHRGRICELELYTQDERACHAFGGRMTVRNDAMFMAGGHAYVYLCYGLHHMLNIVVGDAGYAAAVLIRALEMDGANGPGKLTRLLGITRADNGLDLCAQNRIWVETGARVKNIVAGPRIGVDYAGLDAARPWRLAIGNCPHISCPI